MTTPDQPWTHAPRQDRSRDTARRILDAAGELLRDRDLDELSVAAIARRAGVSVGGFYARFPSKDALLHAFDEHLVARILERLDVELDPARLAGVGVAEVVEAYIAMSFRAFAENRNVMRQIAIKSRASEDPRYVARVQRFNAAAHGRLHDLLAARRGEIAHRDPDAAIDFGVLMVSAALREVVLFGDRKLNRSELRGRALVRELVRAYCAYLGVITVDRETPDGTKRRTKS